jgi:hypothetical protein
MSRKTENVVCRAFYVFPFPMMPSNDFPLAIHLSTSYKRPLRQSRTNSLSSSVAGMGAGAVINWGFYPMNFTP